MIHYRSVICLVWLTLIPFSLKALPPASPAGGGMLRLDEKHDEKWRFGSGSPGKTRNRMGKT